jgi:hypothetical protein
MPERGRFRCAATEGVDLGRFGPIGLRERRQTVGGARLVALRAGLAEFERCRQLRAHRRPTGVDGAAAVAADVGIQRDAARVRGVGAAHCAFVAAQGFGEFDGHRAAQRGVGLAPVEADAVMGAAGAAAQAGVRHRAGAGPCAAGTSGARILPEPAARARSRASLQRAVPATGLRRPVRSPTLAVHDTEESAPCPTMPTSSRPAFRRRLPRRTGRRCRPCLGRR